jgi:ribosome-binding protein aMBF1 (putative translation factor)
MAQKNPGLIAVACKPWLVDCYTARLSLAKREVMSKQKFEELRSNLSENIKAIRALKGIPQERLGYDSGVDRTMVSKIERKIANPTLEVLVKLAECLEVEVGELLKDPKG